MGGYLMQPVRKLGSLIVLGALIVGVGLSASPAFASEAEPGDQEFPALSMLMDPSGAETTSTFTVEPGNYVTKDGQRLSVAAAATYQCTGKTDNPHWSSGSASVIAKTRVTCTGPTATIPINVYSMLGKTSQNSVSSLSIVATSQYTQNVVVNAGATTWYVPAEGSGTKISRGAYFRGSHSGAGAPPLIPFNIGAAASDFIWVP